MKKRTKKLVLNRETLAGLDRSNLQQAAGGTGYPSYETCYTYQGYSCQPNRCPYSEGRNTCFTCEGTCTTNYC